MIVDPGEQYDNGLCVGGTKSGAACTNDDGCGGGTCTVAPPESGDGCSKHCAARERVR